MQNLLKKLWPKMSEISYFTKEQKEANELWETRFCLRCGIGFLVRKKYNKKL